MESEYTVGRWRWKLQLESDYGGGRLSRKIELQNDVARWNAGWSWNIELEDGGGRLSSKVAFEGGVWKRGDGRMQVQEWSWKNGVGRQSRKMQSVSLIGKRPVPGSRSNDL